MRRAPARPARACFVRSCCSVVVQEHDLRATPVQCNAKQRLSAHFTLHSSHPALHTSHFTLALHTPHFILNHFLKGLLKGKLPPSKFRKSADKSLSQPWCSHSNTIYEMQHSCSHYNAFCSITSQTCTHLRTWQHQMTAIMQPFHCDLQPQIQDTHRTTYTETSTRFRTQRRNTFPDETTAAATAAHTRYLSSPAEGTSHGKTDGFVLRLPPQHKPHATFMQPSLQCILRHSLHHHFPSSPPPFLTTSLRHHVP